ncbi:NUDIX hydrolase [Mariniblastus sp.]|nr:NUDIX hydrolase [Mariniblastus sp.]
MNRPVNENIPEILATTKYLELVQCGTWSFVRRPNSNGVVAIVAVTNEQKLLLVEQFRVPVDGPVIELPAGLSGDTDDPNESLQIAAQRELLEETGYEAESWTELATVTSSAGLTNEQVAIFRAEGLQKVSAGGGIDNEQITVHEVPTVELESWLQLQAASGKMIDSRVYAAIHWASNK